MGYPTKIVTCCYCGARAALVLKDKGRHELGCAQCGAPLHEMKMLPKAAPSAEDPVRRKPVREKTVRKQSAHPKPAKSDRKKQKRRKSIWKDFLEEAVDFVEDIFD